MKQPHEVFWDYGFYLGPETTEVRCPDTICMEDPDETIMVKWGETCWSCHNEMPQRFNIQSFPCLNPECRNQLDVMVMAKRAAKLQARAAATGKTPNPVICTKCGYHAWPDMHENLTSILTPMNTSLPLAVRGLVHEEINKAFLVVFALVECSTEKDYTRAEWDDLLDSIARGVLNPRTLLQWITNAWRKGPELLKITASAAQVASTPKVVTLPSAPRKLVTLSDGLVQIAPVPPQAKSVRLLHYWKREYLAFRNSGYDMDPMNDSPYLDEIVAQIRKANISIQAFENFCKQWVPSTYETFKPEHTFTKKLEIFASAARLESSWFPIHQHLALQFPKHFATDPEVFDGAQIPNHPKERFMWLDRELQRFTPHQIWSFIDSIPELWMISDGENPDDPLCVDSVIFQLAQHALWADWKVSFVLDGIENFEYPPVSYEEFKRFIKSSPDQRHLSSSFVRKYPECQDGTLDGRTSVFQRQMIKPNGEILDQWSGNVIRDLAQFGAYKRWTIEDMKENLLYS